MIIFYQRHQIAWSWEAILNLCSSGLSQNLSLISAFRFCNLTDLVRHLIIMPMTLYDDWKFYVIFVNNYFERSEQSTRELPFPMANFRISSLTYFQWRLAVAADFFGKYLDFQANMMYFSGLFSFVIFKNVPNLFLWSLVTFLDGLRGWWENFYSLLTH